jgi:hypothetical protein
MNVLTSENRDEKTKSQAISKVGRTNINHMLGINPFHAQSFPSQKRILSKKNIKKNINEGTNHCMYVHRCTAP